MLGGGISKVTQDALFDQEDAQITCESCLSPICNVNELVNFHKSMPETPWEKPWNSRKLISVVL
jgi:hypothetical protein